MGKLYYKTMKDELGVYAIYRRAVEEWRMASLEESGHKCVITGSKKDLEVHHINKTFHDIVAQAYKNLGKQFRFYKNEYYLGEIDEITDEVVRLHFSNGLGIAITQKLHKEYHRKYKNNINSKTFHQFSSEIKNKERGNLFYEQKAILHL